MQFHRPGAPERLRAQSVRLASRGKPGGGYLRGHEWEHMPDINLL